MPLLHTSSVNLNGKIDWLSSHLYMAFRAGNKSLTIFLFHGIFYDKKESLSNLVFPTGWITRDGFRRFVDRYSSRGYSFVTPAGILSGLNEEKNYILVTFDDGYFNNSQIFPVLKEYRIPACFCLTTNNIKYCKSFWWDVLYKERIKRGAGLGAIFREFILLKLKKYSEIEKYLIDAFGEKAFKPVGDIDRPFDYNEITAFSKEKYVSFGNHTEDHAILENYSAEEAESQISCAQKYIFNLTGIKPLLIAYPSGSYSKNIVNIAQSSGLAIGVTTRPWKNYLPLKANKQLFTLGRFSGAGVAANLTNSVHVFS